MIDALHPAGAAEIPAGQRAARGRRVLLACEMGGSLGHVVPLLHIAHRLAALGVEPIFALRQLPRAWPVLKRERYTILQAPMWAGAPLKPSQGDIGASFTDAIAMAGYDQVDHLAPLIAGWRGLLDLVEPDLVIADYAPTAVLAAHGRAPTFVVGNGFITPPTDRDAFPPLRPGSSLLPTQHVLEVIQTVQRANGGFVPDRITGIFDGCEVFLTVLPQLDHYADVRSSGHLGPTEPLLPPQPRHETPRFFAYLKAGYPGTEGVVHALARSGIAGSVFVLGANEALRARLRATGVSVLDEAPSLADVLPGVDVVLHHGGIGVAQQALAAARPQLVLSEHLEQTLTGQRLEWMGVGACLHTRYTLEQVTETVQRLVRDAGVRERTEAVAREVEAGGPYRALDVIVERARAVVGA